MSTCCCVRSVIYNAVTSGTHKPQSVQENDKYKTLWDFNIQTVCINKPKTECQIIDFAIPGDIAIKEQEKIDRYEDLRIELQKVWNVKVVVILVVIGIGALKTMSKKIHQYIKQTDTPVDIVSIEKTAMLGTAYIL